MSILLLCCLVINELGFAPAEASAEFVEILNLGPDPIDLAGHALYDSRASPSLISSRPLILDPAQYLVLVRDGSSFARAFPGIPFVQVSPWPSLNNSGDRVGVSQGGAELDAVPFDGSWGRAGVSLERIDPNGPSWHESNWTSSLDSAGGTPGARNSVFSPDHLGPRLIFADRIVRDTVLAVFDEPVHPLGPDSFWGESRPTAAAWLNDRTVTLHGVAGQQLSVQGATDLAGNEALMSSITISERPLVGQIIISERLVRPHADRHDFLPDQPHFLELWNASASALSLRGFKLSLSADENGAGPSWPLPFIPRSFSPGETAVITTKPDLLEAAFTLPASLWVLQAPVQFIRSPSVELVASGNERLDVAEYRDDWHDPALSARGRSLVRIGTMGELGTSWASSRIEAATPGTHSSVPPPIRPMRGGVVVTEILFDARAGQTEFIEFMALDRLDLNGCYLVVDRSPAPPDSIRVAYSPLLLEPGDIVVGVVPVSGVPLDLLVSHAQRGFQSDGGAGGDGTTGGGPAPDNAQYWLPLKGAASFRDSGVNLKLFGPNQTQLDEVVLDPTLHHPGIASGDGVSVVRRDPRGASGEPTNWTSSNRPSGSSPGSHPPPGLIDASGGQPLMRVVPAVFDPSTEHTAIRISALLGSPGRVQIFDRRGYLIRTILSPVGPEGTVYWDGRNSDGRIVSPGVYIVVADSGRGHRAKKVVIVARRLR